MTFFGEFFRPEFSSLKSWRAQVLSEDPRRVFHAEDRANDIARKTLRENLAEETRVNEA